MGQTIWLLLSFMCFIIPHEGAYFTNNLCLPDEQSALLQFKNSFSIENNSFGECESPYPKTLSWGDRANNSDCCSWNGVKCDEVTGSVIELDLSCSQLKGTISPNISSGLLRLSHLQRLNLANNYFSRSYIPSEFGHFSSLTHLSLSSSGFEGSVPSEIWYLSKLVSLDFSINDIKLDLHELGMFSKNLTHLEELILKSTEINSRIPDSFMNLSSLEVINLNSTQLWGNLPDHIFLLPNLRVLKLGANDLTGDFPDLGSVNGSSLEILDLGYNDLLAGELPDSIGSLESLVFLDISNTELTGELPVSFGNLKSLNFLDLSDTKLTGELPDSICELKSLSILYLFNTNLTGKLPESIGNMESLLDVNLFNTKLTGKLPDSIGKLKNLMLLDLYNTKMTGELPESIGNPVRIEETNISENALTRPMPFNASSLPNLQLLRLGKNKINGTLPCWLFTLPSLTYLDLSFNQLSGRIHDFPYGSSLDFIDLSNNHLEGPIPHSVMNLVNLTFLSLASNDLNNILDPHIFSKLKLGVLDLSHNCLQGLFPGPPVSVNYFLISHNNFTGNIPSSICNLTSPSIIDGSYNDFDGPIPQCLLKVSLRVLDLQNNRFNGTIPPTFANTCGLETLNLNENDLEGPVPQSLANCRQLELLDLGSNKLNGSFPYWLESLPNLQVLVLHSNKIQGPIEISETKNPFPALRIFDLSDNEFTGALPARYFHIFVAMKHLNKDPTGPTYMGDTPGYYEDSITLVLKGLEVELVRVLITLTAIDLSVNRFSGEVSETIQELGSLRLLNLSHNSLSGHIPTTLGKLVELETLDLSSNKLTGSIPETLANIKFLAIFNVSRNNLAGPIPQGKQFNTFENDSYAENLGLCGFPLSKICGDDKEPPQPEVAQEEEDDDSIFSGGFSWKIVLFGYGCGVPIGLIIGFLMLFFERPKWFATIVEKQQQRIVNRFKPTYDIRRRRKNH